MTRYRLARFDELPRGEGRSFEAGGRRLAVFRTRAERLFATEAECPHQRGPLADGLLGSSMVICPLHERRFDLITGQCLNGGRGVETFSVERTSDGYVEVDLPDS
jgi:nitrite reductase (NADH) small subunit